MTQQPHDSLAKRFLADLLEPLGRARTSFDVIDEARQIDLFFEPDPNPTLTPNLLGLLARVAQSPCALEVFRNPPSADDIELCLLELYALRADWRRAARRKGSAVPELPQLWVLSPTLSAAFLGGFGAKPKPRWPADVHETPTHYGLNFITIHQLPATPETLMLRVLGRGRVQQAAVAEIQGLPGTPTMTRVLELLENWRYTIEIRDNRTEEEEETLMNLSPAYVRWREEKRQEGRQEGLQEGLQEGRRSLVLRQLDRKLSPLPPELRQQVTALSSTQLEQLAEDLLDFDGVADLQRWLGDR